MKVNPNEQAAISDTQSHGDGSFRDTEAHDGGSKDVAAESREEERHDGGDAVSCPALLPLLSTKKDSASGVTGSKRNKQRPRLKWSQEFKTCKVKLNGTVYCDRKARKMGLCNAHYMRYKRSLDTARCESIGCPSLKTQKSSYCKMHSDPAEAT